MKKLPICGSLVVALMLVSELQAATLNATIQETGVGTSLTATSTTGEVDINSATYGDFLMNMVTGLGTGVYNTPELNLITLDVSGVNTSNWTTGHELTITLTETGLTSPISNEQVVSALTGILSGITSETISTYYDPTDAGGTSNLLGTVTFDQGGANSTNIPGLINLPQDSSFSETAVIVAEFAATSSPSGDTLNSSAHIQPAVPEPMTMGLLGGGLAALGLFGIRRNRKK